VFRSMTFWYGSGSGSADPYLWLTDPDPALFVSDLQDANLKYFFGLLLIEGTFISFFKDKKVTKKSQNSRYQGFSNYFCMMMEGSGSAPLTNRSGLTQKTFRIRKDQNTACNIEQYRTMARYIGTTNLVPLGTATYSISSMYYFIN
jgi:hypothetical protein